MTATKTPSSPGATRSPTRPARGLGAALALALLASTSMAGQVWTVGASGSDFQQIQPALAAASDGDIVLVRAGSYAAFSVPDKSITLVAEAPGVVQVAGQVRVQGLSSARRVALIDLSVSGNEQRALVLAANAGSVRVRGGTWRGTDLAQPWWGPVQEAVKVDGCADVALAGCTLVGGRGVDAGWTPTGVTGPSSGGHGLWAVSSQVALHGCTLVGGDGGGDFIGESYAGGTGGHGALVQGGFVYASESSFAGGRGGQGGDEDGCVPLGDPAEDGGDGGDGLRLAGSVHGELVAFQGSGGAGGAGGLGNCGPNGSAGSAGISLRLVSPSTANTLPYAPRRLSAPGLWRGGTPVTLTLKGAPGDLAVLILAPRTAFRFLPARKGVALLGGFGAIVPLGSLDASGSRQVTLTPLDPPAPLQGLTLQLQAWTSNAATGAHLSGAATAALVDSSF